MMRSFVNLYQKSASGPFTEEELVAAARDLYRYSKFVQFMKTGNSNFTSIEKAEFVCRLGEFVSPGSNRSFEELLSQEFKKVTGKNWDSEKYDLVMVPTQIVGGRNFVVFKK
ncbi:MAG TPA: hypothetical protein VMW41_04215 [Candidatus Bathyarchaeia archaeon]|nr:hypothetical protein [Candidatus Bathyarchaeia archaeon]